MENALGFTRNDPLFVSAWIVDPQTEEKPIELRLGKRVRSFLFDRVLRRNDHEWFNELVRFTPDGDLMFGHRFEKRCLRFGRRSVDFVRENEIGEHRASLKLKLAIARLLIGLDQFRAENVGRHHVGRELNPGELEIKTFRQCTDEKGLRQPRNADYERVAVAQQGDEQLLDDFVLPDNHPPDLLAQRGVPDRQAIKIFFRKRIRIKMFLVIDHL